MFVYEVWFSPSVGKGGIKKNLIVKNQQNYQQFSKKKLRLENGGSPLRSVGTLPPSPSWVFLSNQDDTMKIEQTPWNIMEGFWISGNQKKGNVYQKNRKKETLVLSSYSINIHMHLTSSSTGNHQSVFGFVFVGIFRLARGGSIE